MAISGITISILITFISVLVFYVREHLLYWKHRDIPHEPPTFPNGNLSGFKKTHHIRDIIRSFYEKYKHTGPFVGFFYFLQPAVIIFDLDLAKNILIRDFNNFTDRGLFHNEKDDPLSGQLFLVDGDKWKYLRTKISPIFSSGKFKEMFPTVLEVGERLQETFDNLAVSDSIIDVKEVVSRFTTDVIGICAFGLECNSLNEQETKTEFRINCDKALQQPRHSKIFDYLVLSFPKWAKKLRMRFIHEDVHEFFMRVARETVDYREKNSIRRNDFMNLLIDLKNSENGLTIKEIAAQSLVFFVAGYETSSSTMGFALFELALNQDIQHKLRAEINEHYDKNGGKLTYDCMAEMHYLEMVLKETLRKYSIFSNLMRRSLNDYHTSESKYIIPKKALVLIPADAIHRDPEIYPNPEEFNPERFTPEEMKKRHPLTWLPFGTGPRNCIGMRFAKMQMMIGIVLLLKHYKFYHCEKTLNPLQINNNSLLFLSTKGGIFLRVERIDAKL